MTEIDETTKTKGKICSKKLIFCGLEIDKGIFTTKTITMIRQEDGSYIPNPNGSNNKEGVYYQDEAQAALMMQDSFIILDSEGNQKDLTGQEVFQWIAQAMDKNYQGGYPIPEPIEPDPIEEPTE